MHAGVHISRHFLQKENGPHAIGAVFFPPQSGVRSCGEKRKEEMSVK